MKSFVIALCVLAGAGWWVWSLGAEQRAIRDLPKDGRVALYQRTLANVETICASPDLALGPYCGEQARILLLFPECDASCRELAGLQVAR